MQKKVIMYGCQVHSPRVLRVCGIQSGSIQCEKNESALMRKMPPDQYVKHVQPTATSQIRIDIFISFQTDKRCLRAPLPRLLTWLHFQMISLISSSLINNLKFPRPKSILPQYGSLQASFNIFPLNRYQSFCNSNLMPFFPFLIPFIPQYTESTLCLHLSKAVLLEKLTVTSSYSNLITTLNF